MPPLTVPGTLDYLEEIAHYVLAAALEADLSKQDTYRLRLAVDEIATNIVLHGYEEAGLSGLIRVTALSDPRTLTLVLEDTAIPYNPHAQAPPANLDEPLAERTTGGLGVYLAIQNVDRLDYEYADGCNRNRLIIRRTHGAES